MDLLKIYRYAVNRLKENSIDDSEYDGGIIFQSVFGLTYSDLVLNSKRDVDEKLINHLDDLLNQRLSGRPLQYIIGEWDFMGYNFKVGEGVLIPRSETEILVEEVLTGIEGVSSPVIFDLCSGTGCIGLSIKKIRPDARVFMIEKSPDALNYLNINRKNLGLARNTVVIQGDITKGFMNFSSLPQPDVIVSNPPYIKSFDIPYLQGEVQREPHMALDGGKDGFDFYRCLAALWLPYVKSGGCIAVECGEEQAGEIAKMFSSDCSKTEIIKDFSDIERIVFGIKK